LLAAGFDGAAELLRFVLEGAGQLIGETKEGPGRLCRGGGTKWTGTRRKAKENNRSLTAIRERRGWVRDDRRYA